MLRASGNHTTTCAILGGGTLKCWGEDNKTNILWPFTPKGTLWYGFMPGEMGDNLPAFDLGGALPIDIVVGNNVACVQLEDLSVKCWGINSSGTLGRGHDMPWPGEPLALVPTLDFGAGEVVKQLSFGNRSGCAVLENGYMKCWGDNGAGRLGYGDTNDRGDEPGEMGDDLPYVEVF